MNRVSWGAMRPRLFPALALCSLACSVALAGLLAWSWGRCLYVRHVDRVAPRTMAVECQEGIASAMLWRGAAGNTRGFEASVGPSQSPRVAMGARLRAAVTGFELYKGPIGRGYSVVVACPLWLPILLTAVPPAVWARRRKRQGARGFEVEMAAERAGRTGL